MQFFSGRVEGKSVILVGNGSSLLDSANGEWIDSHDIVIRMNLGMPDMWEDHYTALGRKTDIWATARHWPQKFDEVKKWPQLMVWMKLTPLGNQQWKQLQKYDPPCDLERWPQWLEDDCARYVGAPPTTGMRMAWYLRVRCKPRTIAHIGFDFYGTPCFWSGRKNTRNHNPELERVAFMNLGL